MLPVAGVAKTDVCKWLSDTRLGRSLALGFLLSGKAERHILRFEPARPQGPFDSHLTYQEMLALDRAYPNVPRNNSDLAACWQEAPPWAGCCGAIQAWYA